MKNQNQHRLPVKTNEWSRTRRLGNQFEDKQDVNGGTGFNIKPRSRNEIALRVSWLANVDVNSSAHLLTDQLVSAQPLLVRLARV